jgi:hypothetical protein
MNMKTTLLICLLLAASIGHAADSSQTSEEKALLELQSNHRSSEMKLGKRFLTRFLGLYTGYKINSYCVGSFEKEGEFEYLLGIVNPKNGKGEYVALLKDAIIKIESFTLAPSWQGSLPVVKCFSEMEAKRLNTTLKSTETTSGQIIPGSHFDVACVAPYDSHNAYSCYSYSAMHKSFLKAGGWSN